MCDFLFAKISRLYEVKQKKNTGKKRKHRTIMFQIFTPTASAHEHTIASASLKPKSPMANANESEAFRLNEMEDKNEGENGERVNTK